MDSNRPYPIIIPDSAIGKERRYDLEQIKCYDTLRAPHHQCPACSVWHQRTLECPFCGHKITKEERAYIQRRKGE